MARVVLLLCGMAGALHDPVTVIPRGRRRPSTPASDWALLVVAAIALIAVLAMVITGVRSERAGLGSLPADARTALFTRTVDELRQFCGENRSAALDAHCRELASFAAQFDECTGECSALVRPHLAPRPTR